MATLESTQKADEKAEKARPEATRCEGDMILLVKCDRSFRSDSYLFFVELLTLMGELEEESV